MASELVELADLAAWERFEAAITTEARRQCREGCRDEPCNCRAETDPDWRRDAIGALRARAKGQE